MTDPQPPYSYDEVPYPSTPKPETHPEHLAALAALLGMNSAPANRCRVLELGCADGGNLVPLAYAYPESEFVGIDLGGKQIADGQRFIEEFGLRNISLKHQDILEFSADAKFDYIVVYGTFSWVPRAVQDRILQICRDLLASHGVAYISYNVYPGWHMRAMVREMMLYHTRNTPELRQRTKQARDLLKYLNESVAALRGHGSAVLDYEAYNLILKREQEILDARTEWYLAHEFLEETNQPLYFTEFVERARCHGLQFLCEARYSEMSAEHYPAHVTGWLQEFASDHIAREQYLDFLRLRTFRQTLLCHQDIRLDRELKPERLAQFYVASPVLPVSENPDIASRSVERFRGPSGTTINVSNPLGKAAMLCLSEVWPQAIPFAELLDIARERVEAGALPLQSRKQHEEQKRFLCDILFKSFTLDLVELRLHPTEFVTHISEQPLASELARFQAQKGNRVANMRHEDVLMDDEVTHHVLRHLDGEHDRTALLHELAKLVADGALIMQRNGQPVADEDEFMSALNETLDRHLHRLMRAALLIG